MKIGIDTSEIEAMISAEELLDFVIDEVDDVMTDIYTDIVSPPALGVAVDTGELRNSYQIDRSDPLKQEIYTTADHAQAIEDGWSPQSDHAVQRAIDKRSD